MNDITDIAEVYDLLYRLGFSATNTAFFQLSYGSGVYRFPFYFANDNFTLTSSTTLRKHRNIAKRLKKYFC